MERRKEDEETHRDVGDLDGGGGGLGESLSRLKNDRPAWQSERERSVSEVNKLKDEERVERAGGSRGKRESLPEAENKRSRHDLGVLDVCVGGEKREERK
jgi:hypothetical protein